MKDQAVMGNAVVVRLSSRILGRWNRSPANGLVIAMTLSGRVASHRESLHSVALRGPPRSSSLRREGKGKGKGKGGGGGGGGGGGELGAAGL